MRPYFASEIQQYKISTIHIAIALGVARQVLIA